MTASDRIKNKCCVVTGGAGFIGSNLSKKLNDCGAEVRILDDLSTGKETNINKLINKGVKFVKGSILDDKLLDHILEGADYVFHQAAIPSVPQSFKDPITSLHVNSIGTLKVLESARNNHIKKLIFASSSSVYGETPDSPKNERMLPIPMSPYAISKLTSEYYCRVYSEVYNFPTACLRYFNVYGPRQDANSSYSAVIPNFISRILSGKNPEIYGDGSQTRDFIFVDDVVESNIRAAINKRDNFTVLNIASGFNIPIEELCRKIIKISGKGVEPVFLERKPGDILNSLGDISLLKSTLNYAPETSLEKGLEITFNYFQKTFNY